MTFITLTSYWQIRFLAWLLCPSDDSLRHSYWSMKNANNMIWLDAAQMKLSHDYLTLIHIYVLFVILCSPRYTNLCICRHWFITLLTNVLIWASFGLHPEGTPNVSDMCDSIKGIWLGIYIMVVYEIFGMIVQVFCKQFKFILYKVFSCNFIFWQMSSNIYSHRLPL